MPSQASSLAMIMTSSVVKILVLGVSTHFKWPCCLLMIFKPDQVRHPSSSPGPPVWPFLRPHWQRHQQDLRKMFTTEQRRLSTSPAAGPERNATSPTWSDALMEVLVCRLDDTGLFSLKNLKCSTSVVNKISKQGIGIKKGGVHSVIPHPLGGSGRRKMMITDVNGIDSLGCVEESGAGVESYRKNRIFLKSSKPIFIDFDILVEGIVFLQPFKCISYLCGIDGKWFCMVLEPLWG
ncbi:hypothetical protein DFH09DRAFT_1482709 [Mycena vulgaris]|nr:hypothetical protein DFH09DRAFT_1482709 [Mycena vulgaris]